MDVRCCRICRLGIAAVLIAGILHAATAQAAPPVQVAANAASRTDKHPYDALTEYLGSQPAGEDYTAATLKAYNQAVQRAYGGDYRSVPLVVKAEHLEWAIDRYHFTPWNQINPRVILPTTTGQPPEWRPGADVSTWNGTFLAALSYKYAVTRNPQTLARIARLLKGMHVFLTATGQPGLPARCVLDRAIADCNRPFTTADGQALFFHSDAAKGTINQVACGYATMMMLVYPDLPADVQTMARTDLQNLVSHVVQHKYRLTEADGKRTKYGDIRPRIGPASVPFNAQVAYMVVATGAYFPGPDANKQQQIQKAFDDLRMEHHVYYEKPLRSLILPQKVAVMPFIKGMNDRNHVCNAAYTGLFIERWAATKDQRDIDKKFTYQLGRTMYWTMQAIQSHGNALCNFQWAAMLNDPRAFQAMIEPDEAQQTAHQVAQLKAVGMEQLRRFPVNRFHQPGEKVEMKSAQWVDARPLHDSYLWKADHFDAWRPNGEDSNIHIASLDFMHTYWLMRYWQLDR